MFVRIYVWSILPRSALFMLSLTEAHLGSHRSWHRSRRTLGISSRNSSWTGRPSNTAAIYSKTQNPVCKGGLHSNTSTPALLVSITFSSTSWVPVRNISSFSRTPAVSCAWSCEDLSESRGSTLFCPPSFGFSSVWKAAAAACVPHVSCSSVCCWVVFVLWWAASSLPLPQSECLSFYLVSRVFPSVIGCGHRNILKDSQLFFYIF